MKRFFRISVWILSPILLIWLVLTLWVQQSRPAASWSTVLEESRGTALIIYNPDPIYNLDAQLAGAFAEGLKKSGWTATVTSYETFQDSVPLGHNLYVIIANTYNWAPDWPTRHFIEKATWLEGESVAALTLGSGSTERSRRLLEEVLQMQRVDLIDSRTYWLLRPNDDFREDEPNVEVARQLVRQFAGDLAAELSQKPQVTQNEPSSY